MITYTKKQGQYLAFIHLYTQLHGVPPAEADMQKYFRSTPPSVHQMVMKLAEKGLISRIPRTPRSIQVLVPPDLLPQLGDDTAGTVDFPRLTWSQDKYVQAHRFAAIAHQGQKLPGMDLPYLVHLNLVSMEVIACLNTETEHDGDLAVQTALLHDILEDTGVSYPELENVFGSLVAQGILGLTKNERLPHPEQMQDSLRRIKEQSREIWLVKMADRVTNLGAPPRHWGRDRIQNYREEAILIHETLWQASPVLSRRLELKIAAYKKYL